jgi:maltose alpha-D-glucosyltransferase/alpha-amylase
MKFKCPSWLSKSVFYQVYIQSFYDSNNDGIGDINGITQKLDYIKSLGCNAIWLNPCFESPFNDAGYDISDYCKVAKRYGTNHDLQNLFKEARKLDIKVCLDLVPGHTSIEHPWFKESCKNKKNKYTNRYIWTDSTWHVPGNGLMMINGYAERDSNLVTNFFWSQPALNYGFAKPDPQKPWQLSTDHPDVKTLHEEIIKIMRYWLDMGASGFRVDLAPSLVKGDKDWKQNIKLWQKIRCMVNKDYPEAVLISEWSYPKAAIKAGFHVDFMIHCETPAYTSLFRQEIGRNVFPENVFPNTCEHSFFSKDGKGQIQLFIEHYLDHLQKTKGKGYIAIPTGNHDLPRISLGRTKKELELVFAFILTMPGVPFIYYGDEIGMKYIEDLPSKEGGYNRTGSRTPMQWDETKNAGFSKARASELYLPIDDSKNSPNVKKQNYSSSSLLNTVKQFISLRKNSKALSSDGDFVPLYAKANKYPFVYLRQKDHEKFLIALNPSKFNVTTKFKVPGTCSEGKVIMGSANTIESKNNCLKLKMSPVSYSIFKI